MTEGILIFANDNMVIDYGYMAVVTAKFAKKNLNRPVTLVTDRPTYLRLRERFTDLSEIFENILYGDETFKKIQEKRYYDGSTNYKNLIFNNFSRAQAYDLTPYDKTLVIDSDLLIVNDKLNYVWSSSDDLMISQKHHDLSTDRDNYEFTRISDQGIGFFWATAFYFVKNKKNKVFFDLCRVIVENYDYHRFVYNIASHTMRNDFVFSIALHIMHGFDNRHVIPPLPADIYYTLDRDELVEVKNKDTFVFLLAKTTDLTQSYVSKITGENVHVMNKWSFLRNADKLLESLNG